MGIEPREHAIDRRFDQLAVVRLLHVIGPHPLEDVPEEAELAIRIGGGGLRAGAVEHDSRLRGDQGHRHACRGAEENKRSFAHHPRTFWASVVAHHGPGSTGTPSFRNSTYSTGWAEPPARANGERPPPLITATGSPVTTNCPRSTEIFSIPASKT